MKLPSWSQTLSRSVPPVWRLRLAVVVFGLVVLTLFVTGWVKAWENGIERDAALKKIDSVQTVLTHRADSLKLEVRRYRSDSIKAATRMLNTRRATDSSFMALDTVGIAMHGVVPDSLLEMYRRGVDGLRTHITDERLAADSALATAVNARLTAVALATTNEQRVTNLTDKITVLERKSPLYLRILKGTVRVAVVGIGAGVGAKVGGPIGAVVGAVVGSLVPSR
jgi:hypothetical protein